MLVDFGTRQVCQLAVLARVVGHVPYAGASYIIGVSGRDFASLLGAEGCLSIQFSVVDGVGGLLGRYRLQSSYYVPYGYTWGTFVSRAVLFLYRVYSRFHVGRYERLGF